ncbi:MAG TPA: AMP-binding protein [Acidimicrobiales bacterium]|nr:AMP-binding protein [Acidimicrobiales bacterium]
MLARAVARHPHAPALVDRRARHTFAELDAASARAARALRSLGIGPGDRVAAALPNRAEVVVAFLATARLGAVWVGINRGLTPPERIRLLADSGAAVLLAPPGAEAELAAVRPDADLALRAVVSVNPDDDDQWSRLQAEAASAELEQPRPDPFRAAAIAYTSGTTGDPKGVVHTHRNLVVPGAAAIDAGLVGPDTRAGAALALTVLNVMTLTVVASLQAGATTVVIDRTDAEGLADWIARERVTALSAVPTLYHDLAASEAVSAEILASLSYATVGGAACPEGLRELCLERFGMDLLAGYGLTEAPTSLTRERRGQSHVPGGVGPALPHVRIEIRDDDDLPVPAGIEGRICAGAARWGRWADVYTPMAGYWNRPEETATALSGGLLRTGDLGTLDAEGNLSVLGRQGEVIARGGADVHPGEVESVLLADPRVVACAVVGVPDERLGQRVAAFVELKPGSEASPEDLRVVCGRQLARYKVPEVLEVVAALPRNAMGKVMKAALVSRPPLHEQSE